MAVEQKRGFLRSPGHRKRATIVVAGAAAVVFAGLILLYWSTHVSLSEFVNQDLRKLDDNDQGVIAKLLGRVLPQQFSGPRTRLDKLLARILVEEAVGKPPPFGYEPWYVWRVELNGGARFILFLGQPLFMIPGQSAAAIHFFDANGNHVGHSEFSTGWRIQINDAALMKHPLRQPMGARSSGTCSETTLPLTGLLRLRQQLLQMPFPHRRLCVRAVARRLVAQRNQNRFASGASVLLRVIRRKRNGSL